MILASTVYLADFRLQNLSTVVINYKILHFGSSLTLIRAKKKEKNSYVSLFDLENTLQYYYNTGGGDLQ